MPIDNKISVKWYNKKKEKRIQRPGNTNWKNVAFETTNVPGIKKGTDKNINKIPSGSDWYKYKKLYFAEM